ncbi:MAG: hypothetical protein ACREX0_07065 [Noviherbaspirillum sp.]
MQPKAYISYSPGKPGSVFALFYFESGVDLYGWHIEARNLYFSAAFFMVENFYANGAPRLYRSVEDDVYGPWTIDYPPTRDEIRCPVPESVGHELERTQSRFVEEWMFFKNDVHIETELVAYREHAWPVHEVNIKARRLPRLHKESGVWMHSTAGIDLNVVQLLRKYWRLSEKAPIR